MQERHGLPLRSFSSGKALTAGRAARPEVAQERRYLQGAPLGLELPGRIALRDPHCAWQWFEPEAAAEAFPAAHWLAAFLVLLGRYGNEEITLGFPEPITVRGRQAPALLRSSYRAMESSAERSARLAEELDDARRQLSADGQERAALAGRCAVQVLAARPTASSPGWLALVLAADGSVGLALRDPQYDELRRIAGHLARLARGLVDAQACVGRLPWLDADEERRLQALRSEPQAAPSRGVLHHLFEAQARRTPQRIAVHAADRSLSYAELERESAALAVRLRAAGVAPEQRVGVCLRRDSGLLVGLLGVLRAGGCYVPLDPAYPEERVAYMLDDADCLLVLVDASTRERVAALGRPCLTLEEGGDQANDLALPASEVGADHLAYIIYTSGSTGRPKGVAIEHGSAHAFLRWAGQHYAAEEWSGVLAATSVCFDLSVYELFGTLAEGGTLHLVENLFSLPDYPRRDEISLLNTVPSVCAALLALGDLPGGVRTLNLAGERCAATWCDRFVANPRYGAWSISTGRPRTPPIRRCTNWTCTPKRSTSRPSADRCPAPRWRCSTASRRRCRWAWPGNCTSAASAWRVAISASRSRPPSVSASIRAAASAAIAPATAYACARTACWNTSAGSTTRSSSTASASSWARSPRAWRVFPG